MASDYHASPATMARLVKGHVTRAEAANLVLHLQACEECLFAFQRKYRWEFEDIWARLLGDLKDVKSPNGRVRRVSHRRHEAEAHAAKEGLRRLRDVAPDKRHLIVRNSRAFSSLAGVQFLLEEARGQWHRSARWAVHWTELALTALESLPLGKYPLPLVADFAARTWSYLGNAKRLSSDLGTAESQFGTAAFWSKLGTQEPLQRAELDHFEAVLARDQRCFSTALRKETRALCRYREIGHGTQAAWMEVALALTYLYQEEYETARQSLEGFLRHYTLREVGSKVFVAALHNASLALLECGQVEDAEARLREAHRVRGKEANLFFEARFDWLEGRLLAKTAKPGQARAVLNGVRNVFLEEGAPFDAALVNLDLAKLSLTQGKGSQAREDAEKALPVFLNRGLQREANEATMLICRSFLVR